VTSGVRIEQGYGFDKRKKSKKIHTPTRGPVHEPGRGCHAGAAGTSAWRARLSGMQAILDDIFMTTELPLAVIVARLTGAILLGALIGFERETRNHPAGLRTHILVSLAAAVIAVISVEMVHLHHLDDQQVRIDPLRVVEAVTSGVAFLAAGMIIFSQGKVRNLTTGAGMWLSGGVGLSVGLGYWAIAAFSTLACLAVLNILGRLVADDAQTQEGAGDEAGAQPAAQESISGADEAKRV
jgi:putative Mg2+ transporter-C (MgtC) family protein